MSRIASALGERRFLAVMAVLCAVLAYLQYQWTGELAEAEVQRMEQSLRQQGQSLKQEMERELRQAYAMLLPKASEVEATDENTAALQQRYEAWLAHEPRPIFSRLALIRKEGPRLRYVQMDLKTGKLEARPWPREWGPLRANLEAKTRRLPHPPFMDPWGLVFERPIFTEEDVEAGWQILELDAVYLKQTWMAELTEHYLAYEGTLSAHVRLTARDATEKVHYTSKEDFPLANEVLSTEMNDFISLSDDIVGRPPHACWQLELARIPGAVEEVVSAARVKNLALAVVLNLLIIAAGLMLVRHTRKSREMAEAQMKFVATISHELRTPLTVIRAAAHNLQRGVVQDPERVSQYLGLISQNTDQLGEMIEQVLSYAGAQNGTRLIKGDISPAELIRSALTNCSAELEAADCKVECSLPEDLPTVQGDAASLRRAVQNLISNAAKHASSGAWVGASAAVVGSELEIRVQDRGPGIPESEMEIVFEPFVRGSVAQQQQTRGSGLGLSLVREIMQAHGGSIHLTAAEPQGCCFTLKMPMGQSMKTPPTTA
jgi:signal transduction histidine kinase